MNRGSVDNFIRPLLFSHVNFINKYHGPIVVYLMSNEFSDKTEVALLTNTDDSFRIKLIIGQTFFVEDYKTKDVIDWFSLTDNVQSIEVGKNYREKIKCENSEHCDIRLKVMKEFFNYWFMDWMYKNVHQPNLVRKITENGFEKHRLPRYIFEPVRLFHENYKNTIQSRTEEAFIGPYINQFESPTYMNFYPEDKKKILLEEVQSLLEEWSNMKLKATSCYGIRTYTNNSKLQMHVDALQTHAVSAIINVDQDVEEDWMLTIADHNGLFHDISMASIALF